MTQVTLSCSLSIHMQKISHLDGVASLNQAVNMTLCKMPLNNSPCSESPVDVSSRTQYCHSLIYLHTQKSRLPLFRSVVGATKALHMPWLTVHVFGQPDCHTSHVIQSCGSHINISAIICRLKKSLYSSIMAVMSWLLALAVGIKTSWVPSGASGTHDCS